MDLDKEYEKYEKDCERIRQENEQYLKMFEKELTDKGLSPKTIKQHLENVDFFINEYNLRDDALTVKDGMSGLDSFFYFFIHKCMWSTPDTVRRTAASLKKFYKFLADNGIIDQDDYELFASDIKDGAPFWVEDCEDFNDW